MSQRSKPYPQNKKTQPDNSKTQQISTTTQQSSRPVTATKNSQLAPSSKPQPKNQVSNEWAMAFKNAGSGGWSSVKIIEAPEPPKVEPVVVVQTPIQKQSEPNEPEEQKVTHLDPTPKLEDPLKETETFEKTSIQEKIESQDTQEIQNVEVLNTASIKQSIDTIIDSQSKEEEQKQLEQKSEELQQQKIVKREFDPEKDGKSYAELDLSAIYNKQNKKRKIVEAKPTTVMIVPKPIKEDIRLKLTPTTDFSITKLDKMNKGFTNTSKVNCFMNVCLQSLFACPAFFNLIQAVQDATELQELNPQGTVIKLCQIQKHLDGKYQFDKPYSNKIVNSEQIFNDFLKAYNPDNEQQDAQDFLSLLLDQCHEELKHFYVNQKTQKNQTGEWEKVNTVQVKERNVQDNQSEIMQKSIIRDIFGGVLKTEFTIVSNNTVDVQHEPFYVLNLEIPRGCYDLQSCLDSYFQTREVKDYQKGGKGVRATHKQLISKLPNVLCIHLKRFIWVDHLVKMKDFVSFAPLITIGKEWLASNMDSKCKQYRLFSVVEHVGEFAHRGHYVCYAMDSNDEWKKFDDMKVASRELETVLDETQAYILFYELVY